MKKTCKECNRTYSKTEVFFRKNGKYWRSKCKKCLNKNLPKKTDKQKKENKAKYMKLWSKKNRKKINEYQKQHRSKNIEKARKAVREHSRKQRDELSNEYVARLIYRRNSFDKKSITKEIIEQKRLIIKLKREINYGQSKKS